ncbi:MAG: DUF29 domain-containing protein [Geminicoccaceae bacterium]
MATKLGAKRSRLYEADFYVWALEQAGHLRARRFDALDLDNLIEELEGLADTKLSAVLNGARVVMEHLLKLQHSPAREPRNGWRATVREHRRRIQIDLTPRIEQSLAGQLERFYAMARDDAAAGMRDHGEAAVADALPPSCPYVLDQVTGDWWP